MSRSTDLPPHPDGAPQREDPTSPDSEAFGRRWRAERSASATVQCVSAAQLETAIANGDLVRVRSILAADPALIRSMDPSAALVALYAGHAALADELAAQRLPLTVFEAAAFDDTTRLSELIDSKPALIGAWSSDGWQPIHLAARFGRSEAARVLLDADAFADETSQNIQAVQPLHLAAAGGHPELVWVLIASDVPVNSRDPRGRTPLLLAAASGDAESVRALLAADADPALVDDEGRTAAESTADPTIRALLG